MVGGQISWAPTTPCMRRNRITLAYAMWLEHKMAAQNININYDPAENWKCIRAISEARIRIAADRNVDIINVELMTDIKSDSWKEVGREDKWNRGGGVKQGRKKRKGRVMRLRRIRLGRLRRMKWKKRRRPSVEEEKQAEWRRRERGRVRKKRRRPSEEEEKEWVREEAS